jgi:hypothetical protein
MADFKADLVEYVTTNFTKNITTDGKLRRCIQRVWEDLD